MHLREREQILFHSDRRRRPGLETLKVEDSLHVGLLGLGYSPVVRGCSQLEPALADRVSSKRETREQLVNSHAFRIHFLAKYEPVRRIYCADAPATQPKT
jgi:hypothetical protein